jgi:hypothetical protein
MSTQRSLRSGRGDQGQERDPQAAGAAVAHRRIGKTGASHSICTRAESSAGSMNPTLARGLVLDALLMALWRRKPTQRVLVHSGQRTQYGSEGRIRKRIYKTRELARANSLTTSRSSTIELAAIAISVASVPRRSSSPRREAPACLPFRGMSSGLA